MQGSALWNQSVKCALLPLQPVLTCLNVSNKPLTLGHTAHPGDSSYISILREVLLLILEAAMSTQGSTLLQLQLNALMAVLALDRLQERTVSNGHALLLKTS